LTELAENEQKLLLIEKEEKRWVKKIEDREKLLMNLPIIYRGDEKYICPREEGWEERYYKRLFEMSKPDEKKKREISENYQEMLDWVYKYYIGKEVENKKYNGSYAPLLKDLVKNMKMSIKEKKGREIKEIEQLIYVLPLSEIDLLPKEVKEKILREKKEIYATEYNFKYAFCRYFWEAHPILPKINLDELQDLTKDYI
jgi:5'-3' exonuclease